MIPLPAVDAVVIGAGHNGLVCAAYLAAGGLDVAVVERRPVVGGAAVTEEFHPGYRNSVCSYVVSLLEAKVVEDLRLHDHGLEIIPRPAGSFVPGPDGSYFLQGRNAAETARNIARFAPRDAESFEAFEREIESCVELVRPLILETPPNLGGGLRDLLKVLAAGNRLRRFPAERQRALLDLMTMSIGDYLESWFEWDLIKGAYGFEGVIGNMVDPYAAGSAYVLLHHAWGSCDGRTGAWGYARGGMGSVSEAMARAAAKAGADIRVDTPVREVIVTGGAARGVVLSDGSILRARAVVANVNPKLLFRDLVDPAVLPRDFRRAMESWRCRSGTFRMNVALAELPDFSCLPSSEQQPFHSSSIDICPSLAYMSTAYHDARTKGWARAPIVSMCIPSTLDDTLAPPGRHVASLFCQHFNPELPDGADWDDVKEEVADLIIETVDAYAPNFARSVIARQILSPLDLEREFGLVGGDIFHGALHLDQLYSLRPAAGYADYRTPVRGLYMCGSGTHPGGGVTGAPGHNAAREILRDFRRRRLGAA